MKNGIREEILSELAARRERANAAAEQKHQAVLQKQPGLAACEEKERFARIYKGYVHLHRPLPPTVRSRAERLVPELLSLNETETEAYLKKLSARRRELLRETGLTEADFRPVYTCARCGDTGYLPEKEGGGLCNCYRLMLTEKLRSAANLPGSTETFSDFCADYYPAVIREAEYGIADSPRAHMKNVCQRCIRFAERFESPDTPNLLFVGGTGVGKTFMSNCIASSLLERGIPVLYMPVSMLFKPFSAASFATEAEKETLWQLRNMILNVELLIIDDLGTEKQTATRYEEVLEILNTREVNNRRHPCKTIITTNLSPQRLFETYGERVASRVLGTFEILRFCGDDIRLKRRVNA